MRGPKPQPLYVNEGERNELEQLVRRHSTPQQQALRGRMILAAAEGSNNSQIARELGVSVDTVRTWRMRWIGLQAVSVADLPISERLRDAPPSRPTGPDQRRANLPDDGHGLRATQGASDQPVDRT